MSPYFDWKWKTNSKTWRKCCLRISQITFSDYIYFLFFLFRILLLLNHRHPIFLHMFIKYQVRTIKKTNTKNWNARIEDHRFCKIMCVCQFEGKIHFHKLTEHWICYITKSNLLCYRVFVCVCANVCIYAYRRLLMFIN